jgi:signal transduction histidine kinase
VAFCSHAINGEGIFVVEDAFDDDRFFDNPLVTGNPNIRFYAGIPLVSNGYSLGTLCVLDTKPRNLSSSQQHALEVLSHQVIKLFELRLKNKTVKHQTETLQKLNDIQNTIISIIAHDVRSPLASLQQVIELNDLNVLDKEQTQTFVISINQQIASTIGMLNNLIDWSTLLTTQTSEAPKAISLKALAIENKQNMAVATAIKNNEVLIDINENVAVKADENVLQFILRNILSNANKFTTNGKITISARPQNNKIFITVADEGIGMGTADLQRLRIGGKQTSKLGTNSEKGTGVGFALVVDFINKLNETIEINSEIAKGTTITFTIPAA